MKMTRKVLLRLETLWEKGEIARYEKISFSHGGFRRFELHVKKNQGLFGKGFTDPIIHDIAVIGIFNEKRSHGMAVCVSRLSHTSTTQQYFQVP